MSDPELAGARSRLRSSSLADGESDELEFKETLRWDVVNGAVNKKLEDVVVKTVAAFANSQGGSLLIGVQDDGTVVGLSHDYISLGSGDADKLEVHLRNLLNKAFGPGFVAATVAVTFPELDGAEVCRVTVSAASEPQIVTTTDKDGKKLERSYVRSGNSSIEVPPSQLKSYWDQRFA